ncbi:MAG: response regulator transcription factor [Phycisphaerae bacterium]|nr:response regulator transcription factor [Phycisphaerae bacterium]
MPTAAEFGAASPSVSGLGLASHVADRRPGVLLIDDHRLVRDAIAGMLDRSSIVRVVGRLDSADDAITAVQELRPTLVLMDIDMPGRSAFDVARALHGMRPRPIIAFLTGYEHPHYAIQAKRVGAAAFLHKSVSPQHLLDSVDRILHGETVFECDGEETGTLDLSPRELEVLTYIGRGLNTKEMASTMCLSPRTVERHVERLMARLDVHDRLKLALLAVREGLVTGNVT